MPDYFRSSSNRAADKRAGHVLMQKIHNEFSDDFSGIVCFEGTFSLEVKDGSKPYQVLPPGVAYALMEPIKEEQERLQKLQITVSIGMGETQEWCHSFVLFYNVNSEVWLCLDLARQNKVLIRPVHIVPKLKDILLRLAGVKYLTLIDASSGCHYLKLDEMSSCLTFPVHLAGKDISDCIFGWPQLLKFSRRKCMKYLMTCQMFLVLLMTF